MIITLELPIYFNNDYTENIPDEIGVPITEYDIRIGYFFGGLDVVLPVKCTKSGKEYSHIYYKGERFSCALTAKEVLQYCETKDL